MSPTEKHIARMAAMMGSVTIAVVAGVVLITRADNPMLAALLATGLFIAGALFATVTSYRGGPR